MRLPLPGRLRQTNPHALCASAEQAGAVALECVVSDTQALAIVEVEQRTAISALNDVVGYHEVATLC